MAATPLNQKRMNEKKLFHGTSPGRVAAICKNNFDPGLDRKNAMFGEGASFAVNASYSHRYATSDIHLSQFMFLAKVLVGSYTVGHPSYRRPPPKQPSKPESNLYDSCVDNNSNPTIFVVFDVNHFYSEYIIKYSLVHHTTSASYNSCNLPSAPVLPIRSMLALSPSSLHAVSAFNPVQPAVRKSVNLAAAASTPSRIAAQSSYSTATESSSGLPSANPTGSSSNLGTASTSSGSVLEEQICLEKGKRLSNTAMVGMASTTSVNNLTSPITTTSQPVTKKSQSSTALQVAIGSSSQSKARNQKTQQSRNKAKQPQQETKQQEPVIKNLANNSTASAPCKKRIHANRGENSSDSVSSFKENKPASDGFKTFKLMEKESTHAHPDVKSQFQHQMTAQSSPSCSLSAAKSSCKEPEKAKSYPEDTKSKNEPHKKKSPVNSCETNNDHLDINVPSTNGKKTPALAILSALPTTDARNESVKKGAIDSDEKKSTDLIESDSLAALQYPVKVECQRKLSASNACRTLPDQQKCASSYIKQAVLDCTFKEYYGTMSSAHILKLRQNLFPGGCGNAAEWSKASKENREELKSNLEDTKPNNEPQKKKSTADSCETKNDYSATKVSSTDEKNTQASAILNALPTGYARNDSVKKGVKENDEKQPTGLKESDRLATSQDPVKVKCQQKLPVSNLCSTPSDPQKCTSSKQAVLDRTLKEYNGTVSSSPISKPRPNLFPGGCEDTAEWSKASKESSKELKSNLKDTKPTNEPQKKNSPVESCETENDHSATNVSSTNEKEIPASAILSALPTSDARNDSVKKGAIDSGEKKSTDLKESDSLAALQDRVKVECQRKLSGSRTPPVPQKCTPSKKAVFDCILKEYNGTVLFDIISNRQDLFPSECGDIAEWFKASKESFLLSESKDGKVLEVSAFCPRAQLCSNKACKREDCQYVHVCRDYIAGFCRFGDRCQRDHSFQYDEDRKFLSKLKLDGLTKENLRKVTQLSLPQVCLDYNEGSCTRGQSCAKIHICKDFIRKKCKNAGVCDLDHESAMTTDHTRTVLERYHMEHLTSDVVRRMILAYNDSKKGKNDDVYFHLG